MSVLDIGKNHEAKIIRKELAVPPLSGYNHLAIFMKWAYINGMLRDEVLKEPDFIKGVTGECDLREVLANSSFFNGVIRTDYFAIEYRDFVEGIYGIGCSGPYPGQVDKNAEEYFGREMYRSEEPIGIAAETGLLPEQSRIKGKIMKNQRGKFWTTGIIATVFFMLIGLLVLCAK